MNAARKLLLVLLLYLPILRRRLLSWGATLPGDELLATVDGTSMRLSDRRAVRTGLPR